MIEGHGWGRIDWGGAKYESLTENVDECPSPKSTHLCPHTIVGTVWAQNPHISAPHTLMFKGKVWAHISAPPHTPMFKCPKVRCVRKLCVSKYPVNWPPLPTAQYILTEEAEADIVSFEQTKSSVGRHGLKKSLTLCHALFPVEWVGHITKSSDICNCCKLWRSTRRQCGEKLSRFSPGAFANCFICPQTREKVMSCYAGSVLANIRDDLHVNFATNLPGQVRNCKNKKRDFIIWNCLLRIEQQQQQQCV